MSEMRGRGWLCHERTFWATEKYCIYFNAIIDFAENYMVEHKIKFSLLIGTKSR